MTQVKGNALGGLRRYIEKHHGAAALDRCLRAVSAADADCIRGIILPSGWYSVGTWNRLCQAYVDEFGRGDPMSIVEVAKDIAANDLSTVFKLLLKMAKPAMILDRAPSLWSRYFNAGQLEPRERSDGRYVFELTGPLGIDEAASAITCAAGVHAWLEHGLLLAGAKAAHGQQRTCRFKGFRACEIEMTWH